MEALIPMWNEMDGVMRVVAVLLLIHPVCSAITSITPTPKDDALYGKLYNYVIRPLALNVGKATQGRPK